MAVLTMGRAQVCSPGLQTNVNHVPNVRSPRSPSTTKRPFTTAYEGRGGHTEEHEGLRVTAACDIGRSRPTRFHPHLVRCHEQVVLTGTAPVTVK